MQDSQNLGMFLSRPRIPWKTEIFHKESGNILESRVCSPPSLISMPVDWLVVGIISAFPHFYLKTQKCQRSTLTWNKLRYPLRTLIKYLFNRLEISQMKELLVESGYLCIWDGGSISCMPYAK